LGDRVIEVNASDPRVRQRFSIAHEIGHIVLHSADADLLGPPTAGLFGDITRPHITRADGKDWWETEANRFAEALLIPLAALREQIARLQLATQSAYLAPEKRLKAMIPALSEIFDTSFEAMRYRLKNSNTASELFMDRLL
jgi:Zn-dependent peptidase ImmA (M78 family)